MLSDGELTWDGRNYPLNHVILGGELLYTESDYIMSRKTPKQVKDVALAVPSITEAHLRERYFGIDPEGYGLEVSEEDLQYTWDWFRGVRELFLRAASDGCYVLFAASQ